MSFSLASAGRRLVTSLNRNRLPLAILWGLFALYGLSRIPELEIDNSMRVWGLRGDVRGALHDDRGAFAEKDYLILAYRSRKSLFDPAEMDHLRLLHERVERLDPEADVLSLWSYYRDSRGWQSGDPIDDLEFLEEEVRSSPFFEGQFVRTDCRAFALIFELRRSTPAYLRSVKQGLDGVVRRERETGYEIHWGGVPAVSMVLDDLSRRELATRLPLGVVAGSIAGWISGVAPLALAALLLVAGGAVAATLGALVLCGQTMNMVLSILPSMVFFLTLASGIHVVHAIHHPIGSADRRRALEHVAGPLWNASITTAIGLLSLLVSNFVVLRTMGSFGALGVLVGALGAYLLLPLMLGSRASRDSSPAWTARLTRGRKRLHLWFLLAVLALIGSSHVKARMDPIEFLPSSHSLSRSYEWIEANVTGLSPFDLILDLGDPLVEPKSVGRLEDLCRRLRELPEVTDVLSATDFFKRFHQNRLAEETIDPTDYRLPETGAEIRQYLDTKGEVRRILDRFVSRGGRSWRIHLRTTAREALSFKHLRDSARELARQAFPRGEVGVRGVHARIKELESYLLESQIRSLALSWSLICMILVLSASTRRIGLLAILPNSLPVLLVFGTMGFLEIPLDVGTIMVTTLAVGLTVDGTFHYLANFELGRVQGHPIGEAAAFALDRSGPAIVQTAVFTASLFLCLIPSEFLPISRFGLLSFIAVSGGLLLDLSMLPELLERFVPEMSTPGRESSIRSERCPQ